MTIANIYLFPKLVELQFGGHKNCLIAQTQTESELFRIHRIGDTFQTIIPCNTWFLTQETEVRREQQELRDHEAPVGFKAPLDPKDFREYEALRAVRVIRVTRGYQVEMVPWVVQEQRGNQASREQSMVYFRNLTLK